MTFPPQPTRIWVQPGTSPRISGQLVQYQCTLCGQWLGFRTFPSRFSPNWVGTCCLSNG
jgi:hypothetical protein